MGVAEWGQPDHVLIENWPSLGADVADNRVEIAGIPQNDRVQYQP
jgi:hypothetical protein